MQLSDFDYYLPPEFIAQVPLENRDESRLMVIHRGNKTIQHHRFFELPELLDKNSILVFNESKVIPARLHFPIGNGKAEVLLIRETEKDTWECMVRPGNKFKEDMTHQPYTNMKLEVLAVLPNGLRVIRFVCPDFKTYLARHGHTPTPPYIKEKLEDPQRYQTIYAKTEGSVAAPTAGLHFTDRIFKELKKKGIETAFVTLHVGLGTFQSVKTEDVKEHQMHHEWFSLEKEVAKKLNAAKKAGKKIIAVGTTSVRVLESCVNEKGLLEAQSGETNLFIYPGYTFKFVDEMITNFHVPKSSLLMLVSALAGRENILSAYEAAKEEGYRFFSFGDAMLIR